MFGVLTGAPMLVYRILAYWTTSITSYLFRSFSQAWKIGDESIRTLGTLEDQSLDPCGRYRRSEHKAEMPWNWSRNHILFIFMVGG